MPYGVMSGDVVGDRAIVWSRSNRSARMVVEWSTSESFAGLRRVMGPAALETTDFTARVDLHGLPADQRISYRVTFVDLAATSSSRGRATRRDRAGASTVTGAA